MDKDRLEVLLYNAIDILIEEYAKEDVIEALGMTDDEYEQIIKMGERR